MGKNLWNALSFLKVDNSDFANTFYCNFSYKISFFQEGCMLKIDFKNDKIPQLERSKNKNKTFFSNKSLYSITFAATKKLECVKMYPESH